MLSALQELLLTFSGFSLTDVIDILLVALVIYGMLYLVRGTQAVQLLRGVMVLVIFIIILSNQFELTAFSWLIRNSLPALFVAIPVIFQPEIRRGLERLGRTGLFFQGAASEPEVTRAINRVSRAAQRLSDMKLGALVVFERESGLQEVIETGVPIDSRISTELLITIFFTNTPLHDGAVIIRGDRIIAAAAVLPLAADVRDRRLGTRHRAAVGITEATDALAVVVSEETGIISLAYNGRLIRHLDEGRLNRLLHAFYGPPKQQSVRDWIFRRRRPAGPEEVT
ncbi:MAG TPA: diadenylate cyclase CdaA [Ardenticatenaceae bacterium]|jgi:diadenylate cyclase